MSRKSLDFTKIGKKKKLTSSPKGEKSEAAERKATRSKERTALFYGITAAIPLVFFLLLETGLRWGNYMGDLALFSDPGIMNTIYRTQILPPVISSIPKPSQILQ